jgi:hypothetical protein
MDRIDNNEWEIAIGDGTHEETYTEEGGPAIYWVLLSTSGNQLVGTHRQIKSDLLRSKRIIDRMVNPFERLDFAQLAEDKRWFKDEAYACEAVLRSQGEDRVTEWLKDGLLKARVLHELDTIARRRRLTPVARRRLAARLDLDLTERQLSVDRQRLSTLPSDSSLTTDDLGQLQSFLDRDFVCQYAHNRILGGHGFSDDVQEEPMPPGGSPDRTGVGPASTPTKPVLPQGGGWWTAATELDADQTRAYQWPLDGCYLLKGPPGSGKTNILVLRASYVASTGQSNVRLITYTRVLREFIASGCGDYINFPANQVMTVAGWINEFIAERGFDKPDTKDLDEEEAWQVRLTALKAAAEGVTDFYDSLIVDEAQDLPGELISIMRRLTPRLFLAGDVNQRIFEKDVHDSGIATAERLADDIVSLRYHYRIGLNICTAADRILPRLEPLTATSRYNSPLGSRVEVHRTADLEAQCVELAKRVETQLRTYGRGESIGIVTGRRDTRDQIVEHLGRTSIGPLVKVMSSSSNEPWYDSDRPICVMTLQAAKGSEFRAVHWLAADETPYFTREKAYVVVTRAKTALDVYHTKPLPPVLRSAFAQLQPPRAPF